MQDFEIYVLGEEYRIVFDDTIVEHGDCNPEKKIIKINPDSEDVQSTIFHEILHAILYQSGQHYNLGDETAEGVVRALEHGLMQLDLIREFSLEESIQHNSDSEDDCEAVRDFRESNTGKHNDK